MPRFIHRQTLAGQVRFTTTELGELEAKIASAADRALGLELEIFERLAASVIAQSAPIKECAEALARLDVASALGASRRRARLCAPAGGRQPRLRHRGRPPSGGRAGAGARRHALRRQRLRSVAAEGGKREGRPHLADHRPQHGGQVHLPAPERADRDPGADGLVRAGASARRSAWSTGCSRASAPPTIWRAGARPSWSRWWRPPPSSIRRARARW